MHEGTQYMKQGKEISNKEGKTNIMNNASHKQKKDTTTENTKDRQTENNTRKARRNE